jgi:hypothetical protein
MADKFHGCASYGGLPPAKAWDVVATVADLPALKDVRTLTAVLSIE